jgi:hypothetical protein
MVGANEQRPLMRKTGLKETTEVNVGSDGLKWRGGVLHKQGEDGWIDT